MSTVEIRDGELVIDGVAGKDVVTALRGTGLSEEAVVALLGQVLAQADPAAGQAPLAEPAPPVAEAADTPGAFTFTTQIAESVAECAVQYLRAFTHPDFVDGLTVVQAGQTPEELGFNARFHGIESEFDAVGRELYLLSGCLAGLRKQVFDMARELETKITEIEAALHAKPKDKDAKDTKEKEKDQKDAKEKDTKEGKEKEKEKEKEGKDKEKERKDKDKDREKVQREKFAQIEKDRDAPRLREDEVPIPTDEPGEQRTFIEPADRPDVGQQALRPTADEPAASGDDEPGGAADEGNR